MRIQTEPQRGFSHVQRETAALDLRVQSRDDQGAVGLDAGVRVADFSPRDRGHLTVAQGTKLLAFLCVVDHLRQRRRRDDPAPVGEFGGGPVGPGADRVAPAAVGDDDPRRCFDSCPGAEHAASIHDARQFQQAQFSRRARMHAQAVVPGQIGVGRNARRVLAADQQRLAERHVSRRKGDDGTPAGVSRPIVANGDAAADDVVLRCDGQQPDAAEFQRRNTSARERQAGVVERLQPAQQIRLVTEMGIVRARVRRRVGVLAIAEGHEVGIEADREGAV